MAVPEQTEGAWRRWLERPWAGSRSSSQSSSRVTLYSGGAEGDPAADNDQSYEDALLGAQLRRYLKAEYGEVEPPKGVFLKVLDVIEAVAVPCGGPCARLGALLTLALRVVRCAFSGPHLARLVPGGAAVALLILLAGANVFAPVNPAEDAVRYTAASRAAPASWWLEHVEKSSSRNAQASTSPAAAYDIYVYDPAELGRPPSRRVETPRIERDTPTDYDRVDRIGSQF